LTLRTFISLAGWSAAALILAAYALLSFGKIQARSWIYQAMNIAGAAGSGPIGHRFEALNAALFSPAGCLL
jgi:hypothetical protein